MRRPTRKDWLLFLTIACVTLLLGFLHKGVPSLLGVLMGMIGATGNLVGLGAFCRLAGNLQGDVKMSFQEFFLLFILIAQKFPILIGGWFLAQSLNEPYPSCFLNGAGVVYFVLICWVARPE